MKPSKELIADARGTLDMIERVLRDPNLSADVQVADVQTICFCLIYTACQIQEAVGSELYGTEEKER